MTSSHTSHFQAATIKQDYFYKFVQYSKFAQWSTCISKSNNFNCFLAVYFIIFLLVIQNTYNPAVHPGNAVIRRLSSKQFLRLLHKNSIWKKFYFLFMNLIRYCNNYLGIYMQSTKWVKFHFHKHYDCFCGLKYYKLVLVYIKDAINLGAAFYKHTLITL